MLKFLIKYIALIFLVIAVVVLFTWALPLGGGEGSGWVVGILVLVALLIMGISRKNTGKLFTDEAGGH